MQNETIDYISDIDISPKFHEDRSRISSRRVLNALDKYLYIISVTGQCPPGFKARRVRGVPGLWKGYVTRGGANWRLTFFMNGDRMLWDRVLNHNEMDIYLAGLVK